jgi:hypothetical protein
MIRFQLISEMSKVSLCPMRSHDIKLKRSRRTTVVSQWLSVRNHTVGGEKYTGERSKATVWLLGCRAHSRPNLQRRGITNHHHPWVWGSTNGGRLLGRIPIGRSQITTPGPRKDQRVLDRGVRGTILVDLSMFPTFPALRE